MPNGTGFSFGDVLDSIGSALGSLRDAILETLAAIVNFLLAVASFTWQVLVLVINFLGSAFGRIRDFFRSVWKLGFRGVVGKLWDAFGKLKDFLHRILDPIICAIKVLIDYQDLLFNTYLRPLIALLQHLRTFLVLLRLLHVKFAARLDARLAQLEGRIATIGLGTLRELNTLRNYVSLILDPFGLFNPFTFGLSVIRSIGDVWRGLHVSQERPLFASEQEGIARRKRFLRYDNFQGFLDQFNDGGDDPDRVELERKAEEKLREKTGYDGRA